MRLVVVMLLAGCLEPSNVATCGDKICPSTQVCIDHTRCVAPDAVIACAGAAPGAACTAAGVSGRCTEHDRGLVCDPAICGDNAIDVVLHEQCDGTATFATECVDVGYDDGRPACADTCQVDPTPCVRFGWTQVVDAPVYTLGIDGGTIAYTQTNPSMVVVRDGAGEHTFPGFADFMAVGHGRIALFGDVCGPSGDLCEIDHDVIVDHTAPFQTGGLFAITVDDLDGTILAIDDPDLAFAPGGIIQPGMHCIIWSFDGTWHSLGDVPEVCGGIAASGGAIYYATSGNAGIRVREVGQATHMIQLALSGQTKGVAFREMFGAPRVFLWGDYGLVVLDANLTTSSRPITTAVSSVAFTTTAVYAADDRGAIRRWDGATFDLMHAPTTTLLDDRAGHIFAYTGPVFRWNGVDWSDLGPATATQLDHFASSTELPNGDALFATAGTLYGLDPAQTNLARYVPPAGVSTELHAIAGTARDRLVYSSFQSALAPAVYIQDVAGGAFTDESPVVGATRAAVEGLWMTGDGELFGAGNVDATTGFLGVRTQTWQQQTPAGCAFRAVHALESSVTTVCGTTRAVAVGTCDGLAAVWAYDGAAWSMCTTAPELTMLDAVRVLPTGEIFAIGDDGAFWSDPTWHVDPSVRGGSLSASSGSDAWVTGTFTPIQHWDGQQWSKVTTRALGPMQVWATPRRVVFAGGAVDHVELVR